MTYSFDGEIAKSFGIPGAIVIQHLQFWITVNRSKGINFKDGRTWTYNPIRAYRDVWPFWTEPQIRRIFDGLREGEALLAEPSGRGNNELQYAFRDESQFLDGFGLTNSSNRFDDSVKPSIADRNNKSKSTRTKTPTDPSVKTLIDDYARMYPQYHNGEKPYINGRHGDAFKKLRSQFSYSIILERLVAFFKSTDSFVVEAGHGIGVFASVFDRLGETVRLTTERPPTKTCDNCAQPLAGAEATCPNCGHDLLEKIR